MARRLDPPSAATPAKAFEVRQRNGPNNNGAKQPSKDTDHQTTEAEQFSSNGFSDNYKPPASLENAEAAESRCVSISFPLSALSANSAVKTDA